MLQLAKNPTRFVPGYYHVDKPLGVPSFDVVKWVRRNSDFKKDGHAGTLDPLATGQVTILVGKDWTKQQADFMSSTKTYWVEIALGYVSASGDLEQPPQPSDPHKANKLNQNWISLQLLRFRGNIWQTPPQFSAIHVKGVRAYQALEKIELKQRQVSISKIEFLNRAIPIPKPDDYFVTSKVQNILRRYQEHLKLVKTAPKIQIAVKCSSGTYIRSLAMDIGTALECGGVVTKLRRMPTNTTPPGQISGEK